MSETAPKRPQRLRYRAFISRLKFQHRSYARRVSLL